MVQQLKPEPWVYSHWTTTQFTAWAGYNCRAQTAILMLSPSKKNTPLVYPSYRTIKKKNHPSQNRTYREFIMRWRVFFCFFFFKKKGILKSWVESMLYHCHNRTFPSISCLYKQGVHSKLSTGRGESSHVVCSSLSNSNLICFYVHELYIFL
jgi:hypothetical protein